MPIFPQGDDYLQMASERMDVRPARRRRNEPDKYSPNWDLSLFNTRGAHRAIKESMERLHERNQMALAKNIIGRPVDRPLKGNIAYFEADEREAKYEKPLVVAGIRDGRAPIIYVTGKTKHWQESFEKIDEMYHYGEDTIVRDSPPDINMDWHDALDQLIRTGKGQITYGPSTGGRYRG